MMILSLLFYTVFLITFLSFIGRIGRLFASHSSLRQSESRFSRIMELKLPKNPVKGHGFLFRLFKNSKILG